MNKNTIFFLWAEAGSYLDSLLNSISKEINTVISVVHWDKRTLNSTQHKVESTANVLFYKRTETVDSSILVLLKREKPNVIVISGWMDKGYIKVCRKYRKINSKVKIVVGIDDIWTGSVRQRLGQVYYKLFYRNLFDYMWIAGQPQFSFAQRFGYNIENIISNLYSADTEKFNIRAEVARRFIYVGRFVKIKGLDLLIQAYLKLPKNIQNEWELLLIGDGDQKNMILDKKNQNIRILPFLQPNELKKELLKGGVGCLPSYKDQWGVVLHEYALMGIPIIASSGCGATTEFLISGFNGYIFSKGDVDDLYLSMLKFVSLSDKNLIKFAENGVKLGNRITSETSAASLLSVYQSVE